MGMSDCFVSVVAPLQDDDDIVTDFVVEVTDVLQAHYENYELILVDDGSVDRTVAEVVSLLGERKCIRLLQLSRPFGREMAISAGLDSAIGDFVVVMSPETDPPALLPRLVERARVGVGVVYGKRESRRGDPWSLRFGASLFYWYVNRVLGIKLSRNATDYRVLSRQTLNAITRIKDRHRYLRAFSEYVGYGHEPFTYKPVSRRPKRRVRRVAESMHMAVDLVVMSSTQPLRFASLMGIALSGLSLLYSVYVIIVRLTSADIVPGWATLSLQSSFMFLFLFLTLSILSEYLGRLVESTRDRPSYYILEERNSSVLVADEDRRNVVTESEWTDGGRP